MGVLASLAAEFASYYKAILARSMFGMHALVTVWRTTVLMGMAYWALALGVLILAVEYVITMWVRMGEEWPWVSPSTACYLATAVAALWVQKLESLGHVTAINGSYVATLPSTNTKLDFSAADWLLLTEQTMMVTIILSRWLLPKGNLSHKDLSSLLLLYLALSADILDFSTIFSEGTVVSDKMFCYVILAVWTGSLVQFALVLTTTATVDKENVRITLKSIVCSSDIWQILVQIGLQDMPFLLIRLIALLKYQVFNFTIIFFVCKNSLVISLELYHLIATCTEQHAKLKKRKERMKTLKSKLISAKDALGFAKLKILQPKTDEQKNGNQGPVKESKVNGLSLFAASISKSKPKAAEESIDVQKPPVTETNIKTKAKTAVENESTDVQTPPIAETNILDQDKVSAMTLLALKMANKKVSSDIDHGFKNAMESKWSPSQLAHENNRDTEVNSALERMKESNQKVERSTPPLSHFMRPLSRDSTHDTINRWTKMDDSKARSPVTPSSVFLYNGDVF